jgi:hypothetical protein
MQPAQTSAKMSDHGRMNIFPRNTVTGFAALAQPLCAVLLATACVKQLPAAPPPQAVVPPSAASAAPPAAGQSRLVVDVAEGSTPVQRVFMDPHRTSTVKPGWRFEERPEVLCAASPCIVDLPPGNVLLGFPVIGNSATEVELVNVGPDPSVYRRSLSVYTDNTGGVRVFGIVATSVGAASAITGTVLLPVGLSNDNHALAGAGGITLGVGAALIAIGIWAIRHDAPTYRPGAANHFPLASP